MLWLVWEVCHGEPLAGSWDIKAAANRKTLLARGKDKQALFMFAQNMQEKPQSLIWGKEKKSSVSVVCRPQHLSFFFPFPSRFCPCFSLCHSLRFIYYFNLFHFRFSFSNVDILQNVLCQNIFQSSNQTGLDRDNLRPLKWKKSSFCGSSLQRVGQCQNISFSCWVYPRNVWLSGIMKIDVCDICQC